MNNLFQAIKSKPRLKKTSEEYIDGKKVVSSTIVTRPSKVEGEKNKKFREIIFEDGSSKLIFISFVGTPDYVKEQEQGFYRLKPALFIDGRWKQEEGSKESNSNNLGKTIQVVTYNVWFSAWNQKNRALALLSILREKDPDMVCFQEVTPLFLEILKKDSWIQNKFYMSDAVGSSLRGSQIQYGVVSLVSRAAKNLEMTIYEAPSMLNRRPLLASFELGDTRVRVVNMHLESLDYKDTRRAQYKQCFQLLLEDSSVDVMVFAGDFNFDPEKSAEKEELPQGFADAWKQKYLTVEGAYTFPVDELRIDRILFQSAVYTVEEMEILGRDGNVPVESGNDPKHDLEGILKPETIEAT